MNRWHLTEVLDRARTLDEAVKHRGSCGFMLIAIDNLARINEAYGFDVADEVIARWPSACAPMRGGDQLGRFSGNKFGVILNNCTPDDMEKAAERLSRGGARRCGADRAGPVAVTSRSAASPRRATPARARRSGARAGDARRAKAKRRGSFRAYRPNVERDALRKENVRATDEIVTALNERRILLAFEPVVDDDARQTAFYECLMRIRRADGSARAGERRDPDRRAARPRAPARSPRAGAAVERDGGAPT
jgi:diguanylate cyclase (GGDEF)-like protein